MPAGSELLFTHLAFGATHIFGLPHKSCWNAGGRVPSSIRITRNAYAPYDCSKNHITLVPGSPLLLGFFAVRQFR